MADHIDGLNGQVLAFVGDAVFSEFVRELLVMTHDVSVCSLHRMTARRVNARVQALYARAIAPMLTEREADIFRRGKNAETGAMPPHATVEEYRDATGFEAVIGYLHLRGERERAKTLCLHALDACPVRDDRPPRPYKG